MRWLGCWDKSCWNGENFPWVQPCYAKFSFAYFLFLYYFVIKGSETIVETAFGSRQNEGLVFWQSVDRAFH
ncbi:hypothetical protein C5Y97_28845 [Blastopirellula marina]|uniref:Uncharacterized protein n=1 Tax=Blastopirellula marina TaxID=124 RepID=A0A2S8F503_9BACT|nr:hypothetical protein C5Y98_28830 [Blastopirellula marina]PTL41391.1 hypothetical protein C5Y97_28845 [Blastopirellula marina]